MLRTRAKSDAVLSVTSWLGTQTKSGDAHFAVKMRFFQK